MQDESSAPRDGPTPEEPDGAEEPARAGESGDATENDDDGAELDEVLARRQTSEISALLRELGAGEEGVADRLFPLVYDELKRIAVGVRRRGPAVASVQTTQLVHEFYVRLRNWASDPREISGRRRFYALAARSMRNILVDHARRRRLRNADLAQRELLFETAIPMGNRMVDLLDLEEALQALEKKYPRAAEVVELRFYGGLTAAEIGEVLGYSSRTVERDWQLALALLRRALE